MGQTPWWGGMAQARERILSLSRVLPDLEDRFHVLQVLQFSASDCLCMHQRCGVIANWLVACLNRVALVIRLIEMALWRNELIRWMTLDGLQSQLRLRTCSFRLFAIGVGNACSRPPER